MINPKKLILALKNTDTYIEAIYTQGGCWRFYLFLKEVWPQAMPVINYSEDHIGTLIDGVVCDINGTVGWEWKPTTVENEEMASKWSFRNNHFLQIGECPICEEPLLV